MGKILVKDKEIVVPGQELAIGMDFLPAGGTFRENDKIIAAQLGLASISGRLIKLIPLGGVYVPKRGDTVIGKIVDMSFGGWYIDIGSAYEASLSIRDAQEYISRDADLSQYYDFGDIISAKVTKVTRSKAIDLTMKGPGLRKLTGGKIINVTPSKVPRIIGKQGSMISMIKEITECRIIVGQNGRVWIQGSNSEKEMLATEAIMKIDAESHTDGLTEKIEKFLESKIKK